MDPVVPIVPSVAVIVTIVSIRGIVGVPVSVPVVELNTNPYSEKSIEDVYVIGYAAAVDTAVNIIGVM